MSTVGDILSTVGGCHDKCGDILSTMEESWYCGGYLEYRGGCSVLWGYIMHVGGYHEYRGGCSVPWGKNLLLFEYPMILNTPTVLMMSPTCIMICPHST